MQAPISLGRPQELRLGRVIAVTEIRIKISFCFLTRVLENNYAILFITYKYRFGLLIAIDIYLILKIHVV